MSEAPDLCARAHFGATRVVHDGVGYVGLISTHRTQVNAGGDCARLCADLMLHPGLGRLGCSIISEGQLCFGGFANIDGYVTGVLRGVLSGHIVMFHTVTSCIQELKTDRDINCSDPPGVPGDCYWPIGGLDCIYCVEPADVVQCTFLQDTTEYPCDAHGAPGGAMEVAFPVGARIVPKAGQWDIYGNDRPFDGGGTLGTVKYYLKKQIGLQYDPLWMPPGYQNVCRRCKNWVCTVVTHYLPEVWRLRCSEVLPEATVEADPDGACCYHDNHGDWDCEWLKKSWCEGLYNGTFMGAGLTCDEVNCGSFYHAACCMPDGACWMLECADCEQRGGRWLGSATTCLANGDRCQSYEVNLGLRDLTLRVSDPIGVVEFGCGKPSRCFHYYDQFCFTAGPDTDHCGGDRCWDHLTEQSPDLLWLDSITVDFSGRYAGATAEELSQYPHVEPECVSISNAVFAQVSGLLKSVGNHPRLNHHDRTALNRWWEQLGWECRDAPVVCDVTVSPYRSTCAFPAELVIRNILAVLWLSGENINQDYDFTQDQPWQVRIVAVFKLDVVLGVRMKEGWQDVECPAELVETLWNPCDSIFVDPTLYRIVAADGCSRVPLKLHWEGLQGPGPWSSGGFSYFLYQAAGCRRLVRAIDGLVIPGTVNKTAAPTGLQRYAGDVVLLIND